MKKEIRILFSDFPGLTNPALICRIISQEFDILIDDCNPDYVIYSVFGNEYLKHKGCIRIFFTGENVRPDFNLCDYAFSYDWIEFGDRHFRAPNFMMYPQWEDILNRRSSKLMSLEARAAFCNFIYSNGEGHPARDAFFRTLHGVQPVESYGSHLRNSTRVIGPPYQGDWSAPKVDSQRAFKFSIAFENSSSPGYTTEKLVHALAADTIPIYWGDPLVDRTFNADRIIDVRKLGTEGALNLIMKLHSDDQAYLEYVNRPFFSPEADLSSLTSDALLEAFARIFAVPKERALRRNHYFWGKKYEDRRQAEVRSAEIVKRVKRTFFWWK